MSPKQVIIVSCNSIFSKHFELLNLISISVWFVGDFKRSLNESIKLHVCD